MPVSVEDRSDSAADLRHVASTFLGVVALVSFAERVPGTRQRSLQEIERDLGARMCGMGTPALTAPGWTMPAGPTVRQITDGDVPVPPRSS